MANDSLGKLFNKGVATISVKTSSALEKNKYRTHINTLNDEINQLETVIGEKAYNTWLSGSFDISVIEEELQLIMRKKQEIKELEIRIKQVDEDSRNILGSGEHQQNSGIVEKRFCPNCGTEYSRPIKFCTNCGYKMEQ